MKNYLFPKLFSSLSVSELMSVCGELGFDGVTALVREGYALTPGNISTALPQYVKTANKFGLEVKYGQVPFHPATLSEHGEVLRAFALCGIEQFRVGFNPRTSVPARELSCRCAEYARAAALEAKKYGLRAVIQIHNGMYPHNATAAWETVRRLDARYIGVKLDLGNNLVGEGYEEPSYQVSLLGEYIAAVGEKDAGVFRRGRGDRGSCGWSRRFVPAQQGIADYDALFSALSTAGFCGVGVLMPFYSADNYEKMLSSLRGELSYFRRCQKEAGL